MVIEKKHSHYSTTSNNTNDCDFGFEFTNDEIEVANTLLNLPYLISNSLSDYRFTYSWGSTRPRSAVDNPPPPKVVETAVEKPENTSPDTPLAFFPNGSNGKSKPSVKRTREELQLMVDERIQTQHTLMEETDKVKLHLEKLKSENYELKAKKQKLEACEGLNHVIECTPTPTQQQITKLNDQVHAGPSTSTQLHHEAPLIPPPPHHNYHQRFIINQTAYLEPDFGGQPQYHRVPQMGPLGFDLNVSAEDTIAMESALQPLDRVTAKQARARTARQNRVQINKFKKTTRVR